jgi:hypothetical protein
VSQSLFPTEDTKHGQMALESLGNIGSLVINSKQIMFLVL